MAIGAADACDNCPGAEQIPDSKDSNGDGTGDAATRRRGRLDTRGCCRASRHHHLRTALSRPPGSSTSPPPAPWCRSGVPSTQRCDTAIRVQLLVLRRRLLRAVPAVDQRLHQLSSPDLAMDVVAPVSPSTFSPMGRWLGCGGHLRPDHWARWRSADAPRRRPQSPEDGVDRDSTPCSMPPSAATGNV